MGEDVVELGHLLKFLTAEQINLIDEVLLSVGEFGEVRLVVSDSQLQQVVRTKSYDALKWTAGELGG